MEFNSRHLIIIVLLFAILVVYKTYFDDGVSRLCEAQYEIQQQEWNGIVTQKYIDGDNHNYKTINILNEDGKEINTMLLTFERSSVFDRINIGDSIYKESNSLIVKTNNFTEKIVTGCEEKN